MTSEAIKEARRHEAWTALVGPAVTVVDFVDGDNETSPETMVHDYLAHCVDPNALALFVWPAFEIELTDCAIERLLCSDEVCEAASLLVDIVERERTHRDHTMKNPKQTCK